MRCLILLAFCISSAFGFFDLASYSSHLPLASRVPLPNVQFHIGQAESRMKRDTRLHELDDPNDCILNCTNDFHDRLHDLNDTDSESVKAEKLCSALDPVDACYKSCPESEFRTLMSDFLPIMKQPCLLGVDKMGELHDILDCSNSTSDAVADKCEAVCNNSFAGDIRAESRILLNMDPSFILYDDDKQENTAALKSICKFLSCQQECGDAIIKAKCGQMAVDVDHKITSSIFGSIVKLYSDLGALNGEIHECKAIM